MTHCSCPRWAYRPPTPPPSHSFPPRPSPGTTWSLRHHSSWSDASRRRMTAARRCAAGLVISASIKPSTKASRSRARLAPSDRGTPVAAARPVVAQRSWLSRRRVLESRTVPMTRMTARLFHPRVATHLSQSPRVEMTSRRRDCRSPCSGFSSAQPTPCQRHPLPSFGAPKHLLDTDDDSLSAYGPNGFKARHHAAFRMNWTRPAGSVTASRLRPSTLPAAPGSR